MLSFPKRSVLEEDSPDWAHTSDLDDNLLVLRTVIVHPAGRVLHVAAGSERRRVFTIDVFPDTRIPSP